MGVLVTVPPTQEPLDLDTVKEQLRIDGDDDDALLLRLITPARMMAEHILGRVLITQTLAYTLDAWPDTSWMALPKPPVQSVTSVAYIDSAGDSQTWDSAEYTVSLDDWRPRLAPVYGGSWPSPRGQLDAITVTYVAGYGDTGLDVPGPILQAMLLMIDKMFGSDCGGTEPESGAPLALLSLYRVLSV